MNSRIEELGANLKSGVESMRTEFRRVLFRAQKFKKHRDIYKGMYQKSEKRAIDAERMVHAQRQELEDTRRELNRALEGVNQEVVLYNNNGNAGGNANGSAIVLYAQNNAQVPPQGLSQQVALYGNSDAQSAFTEVRGSFVAKVVPTQWGVFYAEVRASVDGLHPTTVTGFFRT
jgi:hypothetical protein